MTRCQREQLGELILLGVIAIAVALLAYAAIRDGNAGESAAWSAILMAIVNAVKERMSSRTVDRMGDQLATSAPRSPNGDVTVQGENVTVEKETGK